MKIALFIIATGSYIKYVYPLVESVRKYFITNHKLDIFIFTDSKEVPEDTIKIYEKHRPFPYPTLMRYNIISNYVHMYSDYDCYYYSDADMLFVDKVSDEVLGELVATKHPGLWNRNPYYFGYERDEKSSAYIKKGDGVIYACGGFNGGKRYLDMARIISYMVDIDQYKGHTPVWHDESYLNRYLISYPPDVILDPSYCYPETDDLIDKWGLRCFKPKLIALTKNK